MQRLRMRSVDTHKDRSINLLDGIKHAERHHGLQIICEAEANRKKLKRVQRASQRLPFQREGQAWQNRQRQNQLRVISLLVYVERGRTAPEQDSEFVLKRAGARRQSPICASWSGGSQPRSVHTDEPGYVTFHNSSPSLSEDVIMSAGTHESRSASMIPRGSSCATWCPRIYRRHRSRRDEGRNGEQRMQEHPRWERMKMEVQIRMEC
ncbi:uncharacterized [Tachysurus ichikawai]